MFKRPLETLGNSFEFIPSVTDFFKSRSSIWSRFLRDDDNHDDDDDDDDDDDYYGISCPFGIPFSLGSI